MGRILAVSQDNLQKDLSRFSWHSRLNVYDLREKLLNKYKDLDLNEPRITISITKKGNLMLRWKRLTFAVSEEGLKLNRADLADSIKSMIQYTPKYKQRSELKRLVAQKSIYNTQDFTRSDGLKVLTYKLILTKDGIPYFVIRNKIRRLSKESLIKNYTTFIQALFNIPGMESYGGVLDIVDNEIDAKEYLIMLYKYFLKIFPIIEYLDVNPSLCNISNEKDYQYHFRNLLSNNSNVAILTSNICDYPKYIRKLLGSTTFCYKEILLDKYLYLKKIKFTNTEVVKELLDPSSSIMIDNYPQAQYIKHMRRFYKDKNVDVDKLIMDRFKINNLNSWEYSDTFRMFNQCLFRRRTMKDKKFPELNMSKIFKNNLKDAHDYLSEINRTDVAIENYHRYDNITLELDDVVGDYLFFQPQDSIELTRLASIMNNCVAGYNDKIKRNECKIIYAVNRNCPQILDYIRNGVGNLQALQIEIKSQKLPQTLCIEVLSKINSNTTLEYPNFRNLLQYNTRNEFNLKTSYVNQNFTYSNYIPSGAAMEASKEYFRKHNIKYDYQESIPSWCNGRVYPTII